MAKIVVSRETGDLYTVRVERTRQGEGQTRVQRGVTLGNVPVVLTNLLQAVREGRARASDRSEV
jgi:hypothetical protein